MRETPALFSATRRRLPSFTDAALRRLDRDGFTGIVTAESVPGLELRLARKRSTWRFRYRPAGQRAQRVVTLGDWPATGVAAAVVLRDAAQALIDRGDDPARQRHLHRDGTLDELIATWLAAGLAKAHGKAAKGLRRHLPAFLDRRVRSLDAAELNRALDAIADGVGRSTAAALDRDLRMVLRFGVREGWLALDPLAGHTRRRAPGRRVYPTGVMLHHMWRAADELPVHLGDFLRAMLLCAARSREIAEMAVGDLDLDAAVWELPEAKSKSKKAVIVPLSPPLVEVLRRRIGRRRRLDARVFEGPNGGSLLPHGRTKIHAHVNDALGQTGDVRVRMHDFRRGMSRGLMLQGFGSDEVDAALRHTSGGRLLTRSGLASNYMDVSMARRIAEPLCRHAALVTGAGKAAERAWVEETERRLGLRTRGEA
jgi:integrase